MPVGLQVPARTAAEGRKSIVIRIRGSNVFIKNIVLRLFSVKGKPQKLAFGIVTIRLADLL